MINNILFIIKLYIKKSIALLFVIILFALFGSIFTIQKQTLIYSEQFFLVGFRMLLAGILLLAYAYFRNKNIFLSIKFNHIKIFLLLSLCNIYLTNMFEIWGINHMVSSKACLLYSLSPFLTALIAYVSIKEKLNKRKAIGMIIGFIGIVPILYMKSSKELTSGTFIAFSLAEFSIILAVVFNIYGWILLKKLILLRYPLVLSNGISMFFGGLFGLIHSYISGESWNPFPVTNMNLFLFYTLIMCLISNIICYNLYGFLLNYFSLTFMAFAGLITPCFALLFGWLFLNEFVDYYYFLSIFLFFFGLLIFYKEEIKIK